MTDTNKLFDENIQLAMHIVSSHEVRLKISTEEFEQNVLIALWDACRCYNPKYGTFEQFLWDTLPEALTNVTAADVSEGEVLVDVDYAYSPENEAITDIMIDEVCEYLSNRCDFHSKYTILLVPFYVEDIRAGYKVRTYRDMAKAVGCSVDSALQGYNKIRRIIRYYTQCVKGYGWNANQQQYIYDYIK